MKTLRQLLAEKQHPLAVVSPADTVFHALGIMAQHEVGALLVLDGEDLVGIFSERDYARKVILQGKGSRQTKVSEVMTGKVVYVKQNATIEECMAIMTEKHIRHLPVLENGKVIGLVSIGDVVKSIIAGHEETIQQLAGYIAGDLKT